MHFSRSQNPAAYALPLHTRLLSAALVLVHHDLLLRADLLRLVTLYEERYEPHVVLVSLLMHCKHDGLVICYARHLASLCRVPARELYAAINTFTEHLIVLQKSARPDNVARSRARRIRIGQVASRLYIFFCSSSGN